MKRINIIIVLSFLVLLFNFVGCTKKKNTQDKEFLSSAVTNNKVATSSPSATQDIFDEFYKEETGNSKIKKEVTETKEKEKPKSSSSYKKSSNSETPFFSEKGKYIVQVATVPSFALAEKIMKKLKEKGYPAYISEVINPSPSLSGTFYRVRIGGFNGINEARDFGEKFLLPAGYEYWIDKRSNDSKGSNVESVPSAGAYYSPESQPKADYLYYTPSNYSPESSSTASTSSSVANQNQGAGSSAASNTISSGKQTSEGTPQPQPTPQSQTPVKQSEESEWKDEW